ncbi:MAG TPA: NAD-dependent epimerase/dehydratase family protein [Casimicrobiaceae bacterium]
MNLLVLGGTRFLGRHLVDAALVRGHSVTVFSRGHNPLPWSGHVEALIGNRDPRIAPGLAALEGRAWDAVVDTSGYVPRIVDASASLLASCAARYLFVSSLSVYASSGRHGQNERAPVLPPVDPDNEDIAKNYGALKASCESVVTQMFGARATNLRPGVIVGPFDPTDRVAYWIARFVHPALLGSRAPRAVVPLLRDRPVQFIDGRDLAQWMIDLLENATGGTFNACSAAGQWTMGDLIDALVNASRSPPEPAWTDEATLHAHHVEPWVGLPLWLPANDPDSAGFMTFDCTKAARAGLRLRPLEQTIDDTAAWLAARDNSGAWKNVLRADAECAILEDICAAGPSQGRTLRSASRPA